MSLKDQIAAGFGRLASAIVALKADVDALGGGGGSVVIRSVEVDFGDGAMSRTFEVAVAGAVLGQKVLAAPSLDMPAGLSSDEIEMDPITCAGAVTAAGIVTLVVSSTGSIAGKRNINLTLG